HRPYPCDVLVLEVGTDAPGEIPHLLTYLKPDIGVVTAVVPEHMEHFRTLDAVAAEELALVAGSAQAVVNHDNVAPAYRQQYIDPHPAHHYYGLGQDLDYSFDITTTDLISGTTGTIYKHHHAELPNLTLNLNGRHSARIAAAAYAVGD